MEMVYPKDLLRLFELTGLREETVLEKDRFGVESGELIVSLKVRDFPLRDKNGMPSMKKTIRWQRARHRGRASRRSRGGKAINCD